MIEDFLAKRRKRQEKQIEILRKDLIIRSRQRDLHQKKAYALRRRLSDAELGERARHEVKRSLAIHERGRRTRAREAIALADSVLNLWTALKSNPPGRVAQWTEA